MPDIWKMLEIEPTKDVAIIKRGPMLHWQKNIIQNSIPKNF